MNIGLPPLAVTGPQASSRRPAPTGTVRPSPASGEDRVTLGATPGTTAATGSLAAPAAAAAAGTVAGALGGLVGAVVGLVARPVKAVASTLKFALGFLGDMRTRAEEITRNPGQVERHLEARGMHHPYTEPRNHVTVKLQGSMTIRADMSEFYTLWDSWITQGFGSINDRQYADLARKYRDLAPEAPLLKYLPMVSKDEFTLDIRDGRVAFMDETTTSRLAGLIPATKVEWAYDRQGPPRAANSFEKTIDDFDGDLGKVEAFYNELFDPKRVFPDTKATVEFRIREVDHLPERPARSGEFGHSVKVPFVNRLLPRPASTLSTT